MEASQTGSLTSKTRASSRGNGKYTVKTSVSATVDSMTTSMSRVVIKTTQKVGRSGSFDEVKEEQADSLLRRRQQRSHEMVYMKETSKSMERACTAPMFSAVDVNGTGLVTRPISSHQKTRSRLK